MNRIASDATSLLGLVLLACGSVANESGGYQTTAEREKYVVRVGANECPTKATAHRDRADYRLSVGIGFSPRELDAFESAVSAWRESTGLPIEISANLGLTGKVVVFERLPTCNDGNTLGCHRPLSDQVVLVRPTIRDFTDRLMHDAGIPNEYEEAVYSWVFRAVSLHELGHWLGLPHSLEECGGIMLPAVTDLFVGNEAPAQLSRLDISAVCALNDCGPNWCRSLPREAPIPRNRWKHCRATLLGE